MRKISIKKLPGIPVALLKTGKQSKVALKGDISIKIQTAVRVDWVFLRLWKIIQQYQHLRRAQILLKEVDLAKQQLGPWTTLFAHSFAVSTWLRCKIVLSLDVDTEFNSRSLRGPSGRVGRITMKFQRYNCSHFWWCFNRCRRRHCTSFLLTSRRGSIPN